MFLAPLSVPPPQSMPSRRSPRRMRLDAVLLAWLGVGCSIVVLVPEIRGDRLLGATLPFWLVVAPLVDLAWIRRERFAARAGSWLSAFRGRKPAPRNVRRQRPARAAACNAARS